MANGGTSLVELGATLESANLKRMRINRQAAINFAKKVPGYVGQIANFLPAGRLANTFSRFANLFAGSAPSGPKATVGRPTPTP